MRPQTTYILSFGIIIFAGFIGFSANAIFLNRVNEDWNVSEVIRTQLTKGALYNGLTYGPEYKTGMFREIKPKIVSLGSSRAMQFRNYFFRQSFYNLGGDVRRPQDAFQLASELFPNGRPDVLIYTTDFWNYFKGQGKYVRPPGGLARKYGKPLSRLALPFSLLWDRRLTFSKYFDVLIGKVSKFRNGLIKIGYTAIIRDAGFGPDGSYYFRTQTQELSGVPAPKSAEDRFKVTLEMIRKGTGTFKYNLKLNKNMINLIRKFVEEMERRGIKVIVLAPPFPPSVIEEITKRKDAFYYIREWHEEMARLVPNFYNFFDTRKLGSGDCEFIDGTHGGEVNYARMMLSIAERPQSPLSGYIDIERIRKLVRNNVCKTSVADNVIGQAYRK